MRLTEQQIRKFIRRSITQLLEKADPNKVDFDRLPMRLSDVDPDTAREIVQAGLEKYDKMSKDDAIPVKPGKRSVKKLKPSQSSMNVGKALGMAISMINKSGPFKGGPGGNLGAFITNDDYIMDGHHRWISSYMVDPDAEVGGFIVDFPREELLAVLNTLTVGAFGVEKGKPASGGFDQFKPESIAKAVKAFAKSGNEFIKPDAVLKAAQTFTGQEGEAAITAMAEKFASNLATATLEVPAGSPERPDMPVIDSGNIEKAVQMLAVGAVDVNVPYGDVKESLDLSRWARIAGLN
jgi:hypothetical protein